MLELTPVTVKGDEKKPIFFEPASFSPSISVGIWRFEGRVKLAEKNKEDGFVFLTIKWGEETFYHAVDTILTSEYPETSAFKLSRLVTQSQLTKPELEVSYHTTMPVDQIQLTDLKLILQAL